jgi:hypothetical protein
MVANAVPISDRHQYPSYLDSPYRQAPRKRGIRGWVKRLRS